jgi:APA family basic amino acid/polyamine antiporter
MSGARVPFALARDRYFFSALAKVDPRFHTPSLALAAQAALAVTLILLGGSFRQLFSLAIFAEWLFYMVASSTVFVFRWRDPAARRPYRVWGYPLVPGLFVLASATLLYYTFADNFRNSSLGCLVILSGAPIFYFFAQRRKAETRPSQAPTGS